MSADLVPDPYNPGFYLLAPGTTLYPDPSNAGFYLLGDGSTLIPDTAHPGYYLLGSDVVIIPPAPVGTTTHGVKHLQIPFGIASDGSISTVAQDSLEDVQQCVRTLLVTTLGSRTELPEYGVPDITFTRGDVRGWVQAVTRWEQRAAGIRITATANPDGTTAVSAAIPAP